ncbi:Vesicle transport protein, Use1 [Cynara cardunculus var. scolymus]|uniref:Vesicle transport protein, Use1 n=1 Tax=Cynara cardunculus var. scolymus TaxID=59895 RepID=A0A103XP91_CYNCS|nr:Vesicle transport protein, Use1 [Cynara cardunculus var. scolymus]KVH94325.1 Vesicle transport protein, Use1 [Cynara cardunculus var. scolymus]
MGLSKTEINLRRLLATAPRQQNKIKLVHYVATLREQLEELATEQTPEGFPRLDFFTFFVSSVSKAMVNDYSHKIEAIAAKLASSVSDTVPYHELRVKTSVKENIGKKEEESITLSPGLRRRLVPSSAEHRGQDTFESSESSPILDSTEKAVEHSLASTGRVNKQSTAIYNESFKTSCFTWLVMVVMMCIFVMVVLLIKAT